MEVGGLTRRPRRCRQQARQQTERDQRKKQAFCVFHGDVSYQINNFDTFHLYTPHMVMTDFFPPALRRDKNFFFSTRLWFGEAERNEHTLT